VNEQRDPLEAELAALRPPAISPELRQQVAARLAASPSRRWRWAVASFGPMVAAVILVSVFPTRKEPPPPVPPPLPAPLPAATEPESPTPSVLAYQRAFARSPEEFDALLDRQSTTNPGPVVTASISRSPAALDSFIGDR
jgi:hypothetical protein